MSVAGELEDLGRGMGADVDGFVRDGKQELERHTLEHPQRLFGVLREVNPVLRIHDTAIVTRCRDVVEALTNEESFGVEPCLGKMQSLARDFIRCLNDCAQYERDISILRLAALADEDEAVRTYMWEAMPLEPQGTGLLRRTPTSFTIVAGTMHATTVPAGTLTFAATQSSMLDGEVIEEPTEFRTDQRRPRVPAFRRRDARVLRPLRQGDADPPDRKGDAAPAESRGRRREPCQERAVPTVPFSHVRPLGQRCAGAR